MNGRLAARKGRFKIDFENLVKVLADNLYANPRSAVRELIQNANDSCVRRGAVDKSFDPEIRIHTLPEDRIIRIEDNGAGMLEAEVIRHLASIGASNTRNERKRLSAVGSEAASMLIGQFGIGFLSAFVIADNVVVDTRSMNWDETVRWECEGNASYTIKAGDRKIPGTQVTLLLKPQYYDLLEEGVLREVIVHYADFIRYPIYLNSSPQPVNRMHAPWHIDGSELEHADYLKHRYGASPIALEPIEADEEDLQVHGVLFVPARTEVFKRRPRSVDIFQKRMYVGENLDLLPEWANFVCAVIDCPSLDLVANREGAIEDRPGYRKLQEYLHQAVSSFIMRLAEGERPIFEEIVRQHPWSVMAGAIYSDKFFDSVKDLIPLASDAGSLTLPDYLRRVPERLGAHKTIYYVSGESELGPHQISVFQAAGIPILKVDIVAEQFVQKYVDRADGIGLRQVASGVLELVELSDDPRWRNFEARYQELDIVARAVRYQPAELPAIAVRQADYDMERIISQVMDGTRSLQDLMNRSGQEQADAYGLCFNVSNPTIDRLSRFTGSQNAIDTILRAIYGGALLGAGVMLTPDLNREITGAQTSIIDLLLESMSQSG